MTEQACTASLNDEARSRMVVYGNDRHRKFTPGLD